MGKNILRRQFGNMYGKNKPYEIPEPIAKEPEPIKLPPIESPNITITGIILFTIILFFFLFLYLNREPILEWLKRIYSDFKPSEKIDDVEEKYHELTKKDSKIMEDISAMEKRILGILGNTEKTNKELLERNKETNEKIEKLENLEKMKITTIEQKEKENVDMAKKEENGAVKKIDDRLSQFRKEQIVTSDSFCYIGYDKNQRECTNVYDGDICMSGQVFPTMDVCLNPNLRP